MVFERSNYLAVGSIFKKCSFMKLVYITFGLQLLPIGMGLPFWDGIWVRIVILPSSSLL